MTRATTRKTPAFEAFKKIILIENRACKQEDIMCIPTQVEKGRNEPMRVPTAYGFNLEIM